MIKIGAAGTRIVPRVDSHQSDYHPASPQSQPPPPVHILPVPNFGFLHNEQQHDNAAACMSQPELPGPAEARVQQRNPPSVAISTSPTPQPNPSKRPRSRSSMSPKTQAALQGPHPKSNNLFACSECNYETANIKRYGNHMRDKHSVKAFGCPDCDYRAARYDNIKSHGRYCKSGGNQVRKRAQKSIEAQPETQSETQEGSWESIEAPSKPYKRVRVSIRDLQSPSLKTLVSRKFTAWPGTPVVIVTQPTPTPTPPPEGPPENPLENPLENSPDAPPRIVLESVTISQPQPQPQPPSPQIRSQDDSEHSDPTTVTSLSTVSELKAKVIALEKALTTLDREYSSLKAEHLTKVAKLEALQEDLEQVRSDCDVWYNECRKLRQENRRLREEPRSQAP